MKFKVLFKTPDTLSESINEAVSRLEISDEEKKHQLTMQLAELAEDYVAYGEQCVLEFDTDTASVRVKQCRKCLKQSEYAIKEWQKDNPGWYFHYLPTTDRGTLSKVFKFPDFNAAMAFANRIAMWAERNDHHPQMIISWGKVDITWTTNDAGGITAHDFAGAAAADSFQPYYPPTA